MTQGPAQEPIADDNPPNDTDPKARSTDPYEAAFVSLMVSIGVQHAKRLREQAQPPATEPPKPEPPAKP